jgi:hypothetical protein
MEVDQLSTAEREVMAIVWAHGEVTAKQARDALPREVARNTVRTLLERMEEKGWVTHREVGRVDRPQGAGGRGHALRRFAGDARGGAVGLPWASAARARANPQDARRGEWRAPEKQLIVEFDRSFGWRIASKIM